MYNLRLQTKMNEHPEFDIVGIAIKQIAHVLRTLEITSCEVAFYLFCEVMSKNLLVHTTTARPVERERTRKTYEETADMKLNGASRNCMRNTKVISVTK